MIWAGNGKCTQETAVSSTFWLKKHGRKVNFVEMFQIYFIYTYINTKILFKSFFLTLFEMLILSVERHHNLTHRPINPENDHFPTENGKKWPQMAKIPILFISIIILGCLMSTQLIGRLSHFKSKKLWLDLLTKNLENDHFSIKNGRKIAFNGKNFIFFILILHKHA